MNSDQVTRALQALCIQWSCDRSDLREVKGDDRILVYRRRPHLHMEWPELPEACIREVESVGYASKVKSVQVSFLDFDEAPTTFHRFFVSATFL